MVKLPEFETPTVKAIYDAFAVKAKAKSGYEGFGISISELGHECDRYLWLALRWATYQEPVDGLKQITFDRGNEEEAKLIEALRMIPGVEVFDYDQDGKQFKIVACGGHLRGKMDGVAVGLPEAPKTPHVLEAKAMMAKYFRPIKKEGVRKKNFKHFTQLNTYCHLEGITRGLYIIRNRDTDEIHTERIETDTVEAVRQLARCENIVNASRAPVRLYEKGDVFPCSFCRMKALCHEGEFARNHCRTCLHSDPVDGGWHCRRFDKPLSIEDQKAGCDAHLFIPDLVPGEQIDADEERQTVTYKMRDGSTWIDGAGKGGAA